MSIPGAPPAAPPIVEYLPPGVGEIVWCRFPQPPSGKPGPKPRPALVLSVNDAVHPARVRLVYGTSQKTGAVGKGQMVIRQEDNKAFTSAGLSYTTCFDFQQVTWLPYTSMWFELAPLGTSGLATSPRIGQLHPSSMSDVARACQEAGLLPAK